MMKSFCHTANVRALYQDGGPEQLDSMRSAFRASYDSQNRGTLFHDIRTFGAEDTPVDLATTRKVPIPPEIRAAYPSKIPLMGYLVPRISYLGMDYATSESSKRDCHIFLRDGPNHHIPGIIQTIFAFESDEGLVYGLLIKTFARVEDAVGVADDVYRRWELIAGALYRPEVGGAVLFAINDIVSHAIRRTYSVHDRSYEHFMPCDKVCSRLFKLRALNKILIVSLGYALG